jgi:hypothetical protein
MRHTVLLTCAGLSTRYPGYRPKWSLTHPNGNMMAAEALRGLTADAGVRVVAAFNTEHLARYTPQGIAREFALAGYPDVQLVDVGMTADPVATVRAALPAVGAGPFTVKDCDNRFRYRLHGTAAVAVVDLNTYEAPVRVPNKSYVVARTGLVERIVEKQVVSALFSCGAYTFESAPQFEKYAAGRAYLSQVLDTAVRDGVVVKAMPADEYVDWGTADDWQRFVRGYRVLLMDIDGVLVHASHRTFAPAWGTTPQIAENVEYLRQQHATGRVQIVLTTARDESMRAATEQQLAGVPYDKLVMGLQGGARVVVNDYAMQRGEHTCYAVNIERDRPTLEQAVRAVVR